MKTKNLIPVFAVLCMLCPSCGYIGTKSYSDTSEFFSLRYPKDWTAENNAGPVAAVFFPPAQTGNYRANVNVVVGNAPAAEIGSFVDSQLEGLVPLVPKFCLSDRTMLDVHGVPAARLVYTGEVGSVPVRFMQVYFFKNKRVYVITYSAGVQQYAVYDKLVSKMVSSFSIDIK